MKTFGASSLLEGVPEDLPLNRWVWQWHCIDFIFSVARVFHYLFQTGRVGNTVKDFLR